MGISGNVGGNLPSIPEELSEESKQPLGDNSWPSIADPSSWPSIADSSSWPSIADSPDKLLSISLDNYNGDRQTQPTDHEAKTETAFLRFGGPSPAKFEMMPGMNGDKISSQFSTFKPNMQIERVSKPVS